MNKNENAEVSVTDDNKNNENSVSQMAENGCYLKCNSYSLSLLSSKQKSRSPITDEEIKELFIPCSLYFLKMPSLYVGVSMP